MKINIRQATINDLEFLLEMGEELHNAEKKFEPLLKFSRKTAKARYTKELDSERALFLIAEDKSGGIGYLYGHLSDVDYLSTEKPEAEIEVVYLKPDARGQGIAQLVVGKFIKWTKKNKAFRVKAGIYEKNVGSRKAFSKLGFTPYHTVFTFKL